MPKIPTLSAIALTLACVLATAGPLVEADLAAKQRIKQAVPPLLMPNGSIVRIAVGTFRGKQDPFYVIADPKTIALICEALRNTIRQDRFQIGHQIHSPKEVQEIVFVHRNKPPLRLLSVGDAMFWMSWNKESDKPEQINFRSEQFDDFASEYFRPVVDTGPAIAPDFALQISKRGCEGRCPVYFARLDARGTVSWNGQDYVGTKGVAKRTISRSQVRSIVQKIRDQRILSFQKTSILCIDTPSVEILVTLEGRTVSLTRDSCAAKKTREGHEIDLFSQYAESVMGIEHWVR
jgi:hypothetical protein